MSIFTKIRYLFILTTLLLTSSFQLNAKKNNNVVKPTITKEMCFKLWYGCQRYEAAKYLFLHSMGAKNIIENDRLLESLKKGDKDIAKDFMHVIQNLYGRDGSWANFKLFGFNYEELEKADKVYLNYEVEQKNRRIEEEEEQYNDWVKNGVPSNIEPTYNPKLSFSDENALIDFLNDSLEILEDREFTLVLNVNADKQLKLIKVTQPDGEEIFSHVNLTIDKPATFVFDEIKKEVPMDCVLKITLSISLTNIKSSRYRDEFEVLTKYNKKSNTWQIKITDESLEDYNKAVGDQSEKYMDAMKNTLINEATKLKKYVYFKLYKVSVELTCEVYRGDRRTGGKTLLKAYLSPIAKIIRSQNALSGYWNN